MTSLSNNRFVVIALFAMACLSGGRSVAIASDVLELVRRYENQATRNDAIAELSRAVATAADPTGKKNVGALINAIEAYQDSASSLARQLKDKKIQEGSAGYVERAHIAKGIELLGASPAGAAYARIFLPRFAELHPSDTEVTKMRLIVSPLHPDQTAELYRLVLNDPGSKEAFKHAMYMSFRGSVSGVIPGSQAPPRETTVERQARKVKRIDAISRMLVNASESLERDFSLEEVLKDINNDIIRVDGNIHNYDYHDIAYRMVEVVEEKIKAGAMPTGTVRQLVDLLDGQQPGAFSLSQLPIDPSAFDPDYQKNDPKHNAANAIRGAKSVMAAELLSRVIQATPAIANAPESPYTHHLTAEQIAAKPTLKDAIIEITEAKQRRITNPTSLSHQACLAAYKLLSDKGVHSISAPLSPAFPIR